MGDRAVITTNKDLSGVGVYLHWDGNRSTVEAYLAFCECKRFRKPEDDPYGWAYLAAVIANAFADGNSVGVDMCSRLDCNNYDNGVYVIKDWRIVDRVYAPSSEYYEQYSLVDMVRAVDAEQPPRMRLSTDDWARFHEIEDAIIKARPAEKKST